MNYLGEAFAYRNGVLYGEDVELAKLAAEVGTPCYVYSAASVLGRYLAYDRAFGGAPHLVCYAVKANGNLSLLRLLAAQGAGFDIVSGGELFRVLRAGGDPAKVVFSGVGKMAAEVEYALQTGIGCFNCESETELALIDAVASRLGKVAVAALRVNPDVDAATHPYISTGLKDHKFGIDIEEAERVYERARGLRHVRLEGVSCHIGSQLLNTSPLLEAAEKVIALVERLRAAGVPIRHLDAGGGLGVPYQPDAEMPSIEAYVAALVKLVAGHNLEIHVEPGRSIAGSAGVLLTRVLYRKKTERKEFIVVDAAMNDLVRPALYQAHHEIVPLRQLPPLGTVTADIVGPVCESGDFLARDRVIQNVLPGDLLAVCTAGAYGFALASNYNARPRAAEVLIEGANWRVVRKRETWEDLIQGEEI
jgi:diaminopimelate decarboxylase